MILWPVLVPGLTTVGLPSALVYHMRRARGSRAARRSASLMQRWSPASSGPLALDAGAAVADAIRPRRAPARSTACCDHGLFARIDGRAAWEAAGRFDQSI